MKVSICLSKGKLEITSKCDKIMFMIYLVFLSSFIRTGEAYLNQAELENSFFAEVVSTGAEDSKTLDQLLPMQLASLCKRIFETEQYKYNWKIHINELAHNKIKQNLRRNQQVTFIAPETASTGEQYANKMFLYMSPCFGHHRPIRTDWKLDDYFEKFFISPANNWDIIYVFRRVTNINGKIIIVVNERILFLDENKNIPWLQISNKKLQRDAVLNEVETINYDSNEVEEIYLREMIENHDSIDDPLLSLSITQLIAVCQSIFSEKIFIDDGFLFNQSDMLLHGKRFRDSPISFVDIKIPNDIIIRQDMHPCRGRRATDKNGRVVNPPRSSTDYKISSGRRKNSIFIYAKLYPKNNKGIRPVYFVENFDFANLKKLKLGDQLEDMYDDLI